MRWRDRGVEIKTPEQIDAMRRAGLLVGETLALLRELVVAGITTAELDAAAEDHIRAGGGVPSFKGYSDPPFPASICASVNDEVVHGIPGDRMVAVGDIVSLDCGAIVDGWHGDAAITVAVGEISSEASALLELTQQVLWTGIAAAALGGEVNDISAAVEGGVRAAGGGYGIVGDYTGHGIGSAMHQPPDVPNLAVRGRTTRLVEGLALAVEPMLTLGSGETDVLDDEWTVVTTDGSWSAHFEHTFTITPGGIWVLTALDGGAAELAARGLPCGAR